MYSLYGYRDAVKKVVLLAQPYAKNIPICTVRDLRLYYHRFLNKQFPNIPVNDSSDMFIDNIHIEEALATAYCSSKLNDLNQEFLIEGRLDLETKHAEMVKGKKALARLKGSNTELSELLDLIVHSIFYSKSRSVNTGQKAFGGSSSKGVGVIWAAGVKNFEEVDLVEFFLHEFTHHLIFIDELCYPQFNYQEIVKKENYAVSAILKKVRPLDKVVHSVIVCTEILLGRTRFLPDLGEPKLHPDTATMIHNIIQSSQEVLNMPNIDNLVTMRIRNILKDCMSATKELSSQSTLRRIA